MDVTQSPAFMVGVLGLGTLQIVSLYTSTAPSLQELRDAEPGDDRARQQLMDANIIVGTTTLIIAAMAAAVLNSGWPLLLFVGGLGLVMLWHHLVLYGEVL